MPETNDELVSLLEATAKAIAFCHYARGSRSMKPDRVEALAEKHWRDFEHDARMVIEVINRLVQREAFHDAVENLPQVPAALLGTIQ